MGGGGGDSFKAFDAVGCDHSHHDDLFRERSVIGEDSHDGELSEIQSGFRKGLYSKVPHTESCIPGDTASQKNQRQECCASSSESMGISGRGIPDDLCLDLFACMSCYV